MRLTRPELETRCRQLGLKVARLLGGGGHSGLTFPQTHR